MLLAANVGWGQRIRLPQSAAINETALQGSVNGLVPVPQAGSPPYGASPAYSAPPAYGAPPAITSGQPFDPYATNPGAAASPPSLLGAPTAAPYGAGTTPFWQSPNCAPGGSEFGLPDGGFPQQPPVIFPGGFNTTGQAWPQAQPGRYLRFFQDLRLRYTWLAGKFRPEQMDTHDVELATTVNFPNFLWSRQPLQLSPVFIFHFWSHPTTDPAMFPTELPSQVYSAYATSRWQPMLTPSLGADVDVSLGIFSDFSSVDSTDSIRVFGTAIAVLALTPTMTLKAGINYLDRLDLKLLPAFGVLWTPNPQTRFDIFFPKPKLAQYLTTIGNTDIWWYVNGEYGGGSWAVERNLLVGNAFVPHTGDPRLDINDVRLGIGLEWTGQAGVRGFLETAYVFERKIVFAAGSPDVSLDNTVMLRGGLAY